jgi:hypothetical protein
MRHSQPMPDIGEVTVKGTGPNGAVSISGRSDDPVQLIADLRGATGVNVGGTAGLNLHIGPLRFTPDLKIELSLFGFSIWTIRITGTASIAP